MGLEGDIVKFEGGYYRLENVPTDDKPACHATHKPTVDSTWVNLGDTYKGDKGEKGDKGAQGVKGDKGSKGDKGAQGERIYRGAFELEVENKCPKDYLEGDIVKFEGDYYRLESMPTDDKPACHSTHKPTVDSTWANLGDTYKGD